jgi:hypothetical protein
MRASSSRRASADPPSEPEARLGALELHERLRDYGYASIMQGSSIIQGGALATAAVSLVRLFGPGGDWLLWLMWIVSLVGINAIYVSYIRAAIMEPEDGRSGQVAMMLVGVAEMLQFAIIAPGRPHMEVCVEWLTVTALGGITLIWEAFKRAGRLDGGAYAEELAAVVTLARRTGWRRVWAMSGLVLLLAASAAGIAAGGLRGRVLDAAAAAAVALYGLLCLGINVQVHRERIDTARAVKAALLARR